MAVHVEHPKSIQEPSLSIRPSCPYKRQLTPSPKQILDLGITVCSIGRASGTSTITPMIQAKRSSTLPRLPQEDRPPKQAGRDTSMLSCYRAPDMHDRVQHNCLASTAHNVAKLHVQGGTDCWPTTFYRYSPGPSSWFPRALHVA